MKQNKKGARFRRYFPIAAFLVANVWKSAPVFVVLATLLSFWSIHYGLSVMCVWMGLVCFWVDRKHLDYCLFTPLQPLAQVLIMALGLGISMVIVDQDRKFQFGFMAMQLIGLLGFPLFMTGYWFVTKQVPGFVFPRWRRGANAGLIKPLLLVGWICLLHEFLKVVSGIVSGAGDRGYAGDFLIENPFGWWSAFSIFARIQTLGYILVPMIWRESRTLGRIAVTAVVGATLFLNFVGASRGAVFFPLFVLLVGTYMFLELRRVKFEWILLAGVIGLAPLVTIMGYYRSTQAFRETDIRNVFAKVATITEGLKMLKEQQEDSGEKYSSSGRAFIGVVDELVYELTPGTVPYEGFGRLDGMLWTFVPYILSKGHRPVMQDGNLIAPQYTGYSMERTSIGITWPAELYRRWGWGAVPVGLFLYGLFYGVVFRFAYRLYLFRNALLGFMVCGLGFHFFIAWYWHTVLNNFWYWFYDVPKHLALLAVIYFVVKQVVKGERIPGALRLSREVDALIAGKQRESEEDEESTAQTDKIISLAQPAP